MLRALGVLTGDKHRDAHVELLKRLRVPAAAQSVNTESVNLEAIHVVQIKADTLGL